MKTDEATPFPAGVPSRSVKEQSSTTDLLISLLTPPLLVGLMGARALMDALQHMGLASEEVFRGERLPTLTMHPPTSRE